MGVSWQYIAGFFDGEGSIAVRTYKGYGNFNITIPQSGVVGERILKEIQWFLKQEDINSCVFLDTKVRGLAKKPVHRLCVNNRINMIAFLRHVLPYLHVKHTQAQDVLRFDKLYPVGGIRNGGRRGRIDSRYLPSSVVAT